MTTLSVTLSKEQLSKVIEAYKTIQDFLAAALSPNEIYQADFIRGLQESQKDIDSGRTSSITSFEDFVA